jgi:hypothetical protein
MALDFPAFGAALWAMYDATGVRPEYILPVLYLESGFNPAAVNSIGCTGINQLCQNIPSGYAGWSASQQLSGVVNGMFRSIVSTYGALNSAARVYQANLLPASLPLVKTLDGVIAAKGSSATIGGLTQGSIYSSNAGLDANKDGLLTLGDLASKMREMLSKPAVQTAIAQAYLSRPSETPVADPALGTDFGAGTGNKVLPTLVALGLAATGAAVAYGIYTGKPAWKIVLEAIL